MTEWRGGRGIRIEAQGEGRFLRLLQKIERPLPAGGIGKTCAPRPYSRFDTVLLNLLSTKTTNHRERDPENHLFVLKVLLWPAGAAQSLGL